MSVQFIEPPDSWWHDDGVDDDIPEHDPFEHSDSEYERMREDF